MGFLNSRFFKYIFFSFAIVLFLLYLVRHQILEGAANLLSIDNASKGADMIVVLSGDPFHRIPKAAQLYREGYAGRILTIDREQNTQRKVLEEMGYKLPDPSLMPIQLLRKEGIPDGDIVRISTAQASSTIDEARILKNFCQRHFLKRFIIVTTTFHTARAYWIFKKIFKGLNITIEVAAAAHSTYSEKNWWKDENGFLSYFNEYLKWVYYLIHY